jgi:hypothetical protein
MCGDITGRLSYWNLETGRIDFTLWAGDKRGDITCIVFAADGRRMLTGGHDLTVRLWDLSTREELRRFAGHTLNVVNVAFGRDERTIFTAARDRTLRMWDAASGEDLDLGAVFGTYMYGLTVATPAPTAAPMSSSASFASPSASGATSAASPAGDCAIASSGGQLVRIEVGSALRHLAFAPRLEDARATLARSPDDAAALATLGEWYAFRGINDWAATTLEQARAAGAKVSPLMLARCYWQSGRPRDAAREFRAARAAREAPADYLSLCLAAAERDAAAAATQPATRTAAAAAAD